MSTAYYSSFYPAEDSGAKGSAAFVGSIATTIVYLYKRSATALVDADKPNGNVVYTFATADTDVSAVTNGWSVTIPAGTNTLYVTAATAYATNTNTVGVDPTTTILPAQWATPVASTTNSLTGVTARSVFLFKRQATDTSAPVVPSTSTTYTFSTSTLSGTLSGWTQAAPDSDLGKYLYATVATALGTGATDTILTSEWKAPVVFSEDGAGYTAYLTNESHTLVAATDGTVSAYTGATGSFVVLRDGTDVSASFALSSFSNPQGLGNGASSIYSGNTYTITSGFDTAEDVATLTIRATGSGAHSGITLDKVFTLSKSKSGATAKLLSIYPSRQIVSFDGSGNLLPATGQDIVYTAVKQNTTATVSWTIKDNKGNSITPTTSYLSAASGDTVTMTAAQFNNAIAVNSATGVVVTATCDGLTDTTTVVKVVNGTNGTNGTSPLVYDIVTSSPVIVKDAADAATTGTYSSITIQGKKYDGNVTTNYGWVTVTANGDTEATTATDTAVTAFTLSPASTSGKSSYTIKMYNQATVSGATLLDTQTVTVVFKGAGGSNGTNARAVSLSTNTQAFAYDSAGANPSPASTVITATALNTTGTVFYEFILDGTTVQNTTANTYTYTPQASFTNMPDTVRVNIRETANNTTVLASDMIALTGLKNTTNGTDGLNALTAIMSNSAHTLPTTNAGVVTYTGSGTTIRLYEGTTELAYDGVGTANGSWKVTATPTNITVGTLTDSGTFLTVGQHSAMTANNATISFLIEGKRANGTAISITLVQSLSKSIQGDNGTNGTSAIAAIVSNEAHVFPANSSGAVSSYTGSGTTIRLYEGATELAYDGVGTANGTWTVSAVGTNITVGTLTDSGNFVTVGQHSGVANGTDTSSITYTITGKTTTGQSINTTKQQTFSKSKSGADGAAGAAAVNIVLTREASTILAYADGSLAVAANTITGVAKLFLGTAEITPGAGAGQVAWSITTTAGSSATINTTDGTYTLTGLNGDTSSATLTITGTYNGSPYTKSFTVTKTFAGYERRTSDPTTGNFEGRVYYNTSTQKLRLYTGGAWTDKTGTAATTTVIADVVNAGSITSAQLATTELITVSAQIKDAVITNAKIGDLEVDSLKIAGNAVTTAKLGLNSASSFYNTVPADINLPTFGTTEIAKIENVYSSAESKQVALVESTYTGIGNCSFSANLEVKELHAVGYNKAYATLSGINTVNYNSSGKAPSPSGTTTITASVFNVTSPVYEWYLNGTLVSSQTTNIFTYSIPASSADLPGEILLIVRETSGVAVVKATHTIYPLLTGTDIVTIVPARNGAFIPEVTGTEVKTVTNVTTTSTANYIDAVSVGTLTYTNAEYGYLIIQNSGTTYSIGDPVKLASTVAGFTGGTTYYIASVYYYYNTLYTSFATSYSNAINGVIKYPTTTGSVNIALSSGFFISSGQALTNGTAITFKGTAWGGISTSTTYYAKNVTSSSMQLSTNSGLTDTVAISVGVGNLDIYHFPGGTPSIDYSNTSNSIRVYKGSTLLTHSTTSPQPANTWKAVYTDINGTTSGGVTPGTLSVASNVVNLANVTSGSTTEKYNEINYAITVNNGTTISTSQFKYRIRHSISGSYGDSVNYNTQLSPSFSLTQTSNAGSTVLYSSGYGYVPAGTVLYTSTGSTIGTVSSYSYDWKNDILTVYLTSGIPSTLTAGYTVYIYAVTESLAQIWRVVDTKDLVQLVQTAGNTYKVRVPATLVDNANPGYADYRVRVNSNSQAGASSTKTFLSLQGVKKVS